MFICHVSDNTELSITQKSFLPEFLGPNFKNKNSKTEVVFCSFLKHYFSDLKSGYFQWWVQNKKVTEISPKIWDYIDKILKKKIFQKLLFLRKGSPMPFSTPIYF